MELGGVIFGVVAIALLTYLALLLLRRRESVELDDLAPEEFPESARIVHRAEVEPGDDEAEVSTPCTRRARLHELRVARRHHAVVARRTLVGAVLLTVAAIVASALGRAPWWTVALGVGLTVATLVASRLSVALLKPGFDRRAKAIRQGCTDDTIVISLTPLVDEGIGVELTAPIAFSGSLWDPVPVTVPTYVQTPLAPRTVRTIDLSAPSAQAPALPPTADPLVPAPADERDLPRAVGE